MPKILKPIYYMGGKYYMLKYLLELIPPHFTYVEVFGGAAALLFAKQPSPVEVYNDIDSDLVNFFRVLRDPDKSKRLQELLLLTPYSREEYEFCKKNYSDPNCDDVERARRFFVAIRQSFSGYSGWSYSVKHSRQGMASTCSRWLNAIESLPEFHRRIIRVQIEHLDFRDCIRKYDHEDCFFYLDPPYILEKGNNYYRYTMTIDDHKEMVELLLSVKGKVMLSGYAHPVYETLERCGWTRKDYRQVVRSLGRTRQLGTVGENTVKERKDSYRIESLWLNPQLVNSLEKQQHLTNEMILIEEEGDDVT